MQKLTALLIVLALSASACTKKPETPAAGAGGESAAKVVNLAIWSNYVQPELLADFEKRTGIKVNVSNYSSNEELLAKLQAGASGYDLIVPSDYMVFALSQLGLAKELDYSKLPNSKSLDPRYLKKQYDPTNKYSVPYSWGTTGLAVNRSLYKGELKSWKDLFTKADLAGKFTLLDDVRETLGAALKALGYSLNSTDPAQLAKAKDLLLKAKPRVKGFTSEPKMPLANGETAVAHVYMSDALQAARANPKIEYFLPAEGGTLWVDNLVIPASAPHAEAAHQLMNFLLEGKSVASTVSNILVAPANKDAFGLLSKEIQGMKLLFPDEAMLAKTEMIQDLGEKLEMWDKIWTEIKAGE